MQIQGCLIRIASEDDCATSVEGEVLLNDVLNGDAVGTMIDGIGAEHIEGSLVMVGGSDGALTVQRNIVLRVGIHQEVQSGVGRGVDEEVDIDIGVGGSAGTFIRITNLASLTSIFLPLDKLLTGESIGCRSIINE